MKRITIYWPHSDRELARRIRRKYGLPDRETVNGTTEAVVTEETLLALRRGEPTYIVIRRVEDLPDEEKKRKQLQPEKITKENV